MLVFDFSADSSSGRTITEAPITQNLACARAGQLMVVPGAPFTGTSWRELEAFVGELERILLDPALRDDVVTESP